MNPLSNTLTRKRTLVAATTTPVTPKAPLPPGLAKRKILPPGLAKKKELPPGLAGRTVKLPLLDVIRKKTLPAPASPPAKIERKKPPTAATPKSK
jgi:hypothetical protein